MDCFSVQQLLSESFDEEIVDAARLAEAQRHCAGCPECTAFARGLLSLRIPGPAAPERLVTSVMARIEEEAAARTAAAAAAAARVTETGDAAPPDATPIASQAPAAAPVSAPARPQANRWRSAWGIAAAAALILGFGFMTQYGISLMAGSFGQRGGEMASAPDPGATASPSSDALGDTAAPQAEKSAQSQDAATPQFVAFKGHVYRMQGSRDTSGAVPTSLGTVKTARDTRGAAADVTVYADPANASGILLAAGGDGGTPGYLAFAPVTRTLSGRAYVMTVSEDVERFGDWPVLPDRYPEPASANGSPIFDEAGKDDLGAIIYAPRGRGPEEGFAIAPGRPMTDPTAGNPNWTWWEPLT